MVSVSRTFSAPAVWRQALVFVAAVLLATPAFGQISSLGLSTSRVAGAVRGTDVAYDPVNSVYLTIGAYGNVSGSFSDVNGVAVGTPFSVFPGTTAFAHFPRVAYSPDLSNGAGGFGAFLVVWHHDGPGTTGSTNFVRGQVVSFVSGAPLLVGSLFTISDENTFWEAAPALAYSAPNRKFFVAWQTCCGGGSVVKGRLVDLDSGGVPAPVGLPAQISGGYGRDPGVVYNPTTNQFGVSFSGEDATSPNTVLALLQATDGAVIRRNVFTHSSANYISDLALNAATGKYVVSWFQLSGTWTAEFDAAGDLLGIALLSAAIGSYDSGGLSFNPGSGTFLFVGHHPSAEVGAAELSSRGARIGADVVVGSAGGIGSYYPRPTSSTTATRWASSFSRDYLAVYGQMVQTATTAGGGDVALPPPGTPPPPPPPPPPPTGCTTVQPGPGWTCVNGVWQPPPTGCTTAQPGPGWTCVNGGWVPPAPAPTDSDGDGVPDSSDACPGTAAGTTVDSTGCPVSAPPPPSSCTSAAPGPGWVCVNGGWLPPGHPGIPSDSDGDGVPDTSDACPGTPSGTAVDSTGCALPPPSTCTSAAPGPGWVCVNGGWLPPGHPGILDSDGDGVPDSLDACPGTPSGTAVDSTGCALPPPPDSDGDGVPDSSDACPGTPSGTAVDSTGCALPPPPPPPSSCGSPSPGSGWVCVNGGWLPPGHPGIPSGSADSDGDGVPDSSDLCPGTPSGTAVDSTGCALPPPPPPPTGCTTPAPGPGLTCVNGTWQPLAPLPCLTVKPSPTGWICVDGGWIPAGSGGGCTIDQPGAGWTCVNGVWIAPGSGGDDLLASASLAVPDFLADSTDGLPAGDRRIYSRLLATAAHG